MVSHNYFDVLCFCFSESELEEVLTTYTKLNKSASIFLGSNSKSTLEGRPPSITATNSQSDTCLARRKEGSDNSKSSSGHMTVMWCRVRTPTAAHMSRIGAE